MVGSDQSANAMTQCSECNKVLKFNSLARHMREIHPKYENVIQCLHCKKNFARKSNLARHVESNHPETLLNGYKHEQDESEAAIVISKEKKFHCVECGLCFKQKCHYTEHLQIHQGFRFPCTQCAKSFSRSTTLKAHMLSSHASYMGTAADIAALNRMASAHKKKYATKQCAHDGHVACKSVAFLPHAGHIDFMRDCGNISCRDVVTSLSPENANRIFDQRQETSGHTSSNSGLYVPRNPPLYGNRGGVSQPEAAVQSSNIFDHSACTKVAYLKHEDHIDFLHSCGSLFCHDEEVSFGQAPQTHDNLHAFAIHGSEEGNAQQPKDHRACKSVAFLPHAGHIDFLLDCGNVSCRDAPNASQLGKGKNKRLYNGGDDDLSGDSTETTQRRSVPRLASQGPDVGYNTLTHDQGCDNFDHSACTKVAYLEHDDHLDFLHSCGSLFCHDEEVSFGQAPQTHDNLHAFAIHGSEEVAYAPQATDLNAYKGTAFAVQDNRHLEEEITSNFYHLFE